MLKLYLSIQAKDHFVQVLMCSGLLTSQIATLQEVINNNATRYSVHLVTEESAPSESACLTW